MTVVLLALWPGLAAAGVLGLAVGVLAGRPGRWTAAAHLVLLVGLAASAVLVPGRAGLRLEAAAWMLALYLAAAMAAALLRPAASSPRAG